jgi:dihydroflavonol-4-reductase
MLRRIPAYVDGAINVVDVADVAAGLLLCESRGATGERYILGNRNYTWQRFFTELSRLSGVEPPALRLPLRAAIAAAEAAGRLPGPTPLTPSEVRTAGHWWTYCLGRARRELGWTTVPHEETVEATVAWYREREGERMHRAGRRQPLPWRLAGLAARAAEEVDHRVRGA